MHRWPFRADAVSATPEPHRIDLLVALVTTECQLRCRYCSMRAGDVPREDLSEDTFALALKNLPIAPGAQLQIAGGEPGLVPERVFAIARHARRGGFARIGVQTNAVDLDDRFLAFVREEKIGVGVSLDGPADVNDFWRGRTDDVLANLKRLNDAGIPFGVTTVLTRGSLASLPRLAMLLATFPQARSIGLDLLRPVGRGDSVDLPTGAKVTKAYRDLSATLAWINRRRERPLVLREDGMIDCAAADTYCPAEAGRAVVLSPSGALFPCSSLVGRPEHACGSAADPDLAALRRGLRSPKNGCATCSVAGCRGRCPSRALASPKAAALDCVLRRAAQDIKRGVTHVRC